MDSEQHGPARELADAMGAAMDKVTEDIRAMMPRVRAALNEIEGGPAIGPPPGASVARPSQ
jgi:hypothetical protein